MGCLCDSPASASSPALHSHSAKVSRCSSCPLFFSSVWLPLLLALKTQLVDNLLWKPSLLLPTRLGPLIKTTYAFIHPHIYFPFLIPRKWFYLTSRPVVLKICSQDQQHQYLVRNATSQDLPGDPGVDSVPPMQRAGVRSLVRELRSHMPLSMAKTSKQKTRSPVFSSSTQV